MLPGLGWRVHRDVTDHRDMASLDGPNPSYEMAADDWPIDTTTDHLRWLAAALDAKRPDAPNSRITMSLSLKVRVVFRVNGDEEPTAT